MLEENRKMISQIFCIKITSAHMHLNVLVKNESFLTGKICLTLVALFFRRVVINSENEMPTDYGTTPGGTIFGTTPGGNEIRNFPSKLREMGTYLKCKN